MTSGLRVLCLGDSLTQGRTTRMVAQLTPYGNYLPALSKHRVGFVDVQGFPGFTSAELAAEATAFVRRCGGRLTYDYVVLLAGTNDFGRHSGDGKQVAATLIDTGRMLRAVSPPHTKIVFVATPALGVSLFQYQATDWHLRARQDLRAALQAFCQEEGQVFVDLWDATSVEFTGMPVLREYQPSEDSLDDDGEQSETRLKHVRSDLPMRFLMPQYDGDGMHLTMAGYELLARLVWEAIDRSDSSGAAVRGASTAPVPPVGGGHDAAAPPDGEVNLHID